ncbi:MAG: hypothetical protein R3C61_28985 [Bacteroidia bacterium]
MTTIKKKYLPKQKLIAKSNQLNSDAPSVIKRHLDNTPFRLKTNDVFTYIAASSISHVLDGWEYLSNAINALINGNDGISIHMAYYAELRAVMSLLAAEGIGVFSDVHIGLQNRSTFDTFSKYRRKERKNGSAKVFENKIGTHVFAWKAWEKWCLSILKPSYNLLQMFRVNGHPFTELLVGFHPQATQIASSPIAKNWLKEWAFDVRKYENDREMRNFVSYRPQNISEFTPSIDFKKTINCIFTLFKVLSPTSLSPFDYLDKLLFKELIDKLYENPVIYQSNRGSKEDLINDAFENLGMSLDNVTKRILLSQTPLEQTHLVFSESKKHISEPLPVISRAILLLRVSTGFVSNLLKDAGIDKAELNFIWEKYAFNNGFWNTNVPISDFHKLWDDVELEYSTIEASLDSLENSPFSIKNRSDVNLGKLTQFNRSALWGL